MLLKQDLRIIGTKQSQEMAWLLFCANHVNLTQPLVYSTNIYWASAIWGGKLVKERCLLEAINLFIWNSPFLPRMFLLIVYLYQGKAFCRPPRVASLPTPFLQNCCFLVAVCRHEGKGYCRNITFQSLKTDVPSTGLCWVPAHQDRSQ